MITAQKNARSILKVLEEAGFGDLQITQSDLANPDIVIQLGYAPHRIDIMTSVSGLDFDNAFKRKVEGEYLGVAADFISLNDLIENKKASDRKKDLEDIDWIRKYS